MKLKGQTTYKEFHARMMKIPGHKEAYDALEPEYSIIDALIKARKDKNLSQRELAKRVGIAQSALARIESGKVNSTIESVQKLLALTGHRLKVVKA